MTLPISAADAASAGATGRLGWWLYRSAPTAAAVAAKFSKIILKVLGLQLRICGRRKRAESIPNEV